jgi:hypothetical protein
MPKQFKFTLYDKNGTPIKKGDIVYILSARAVGRVVSCKTMLNEYGNPDGEVKIEPANMLFYKYSSAFDKTITFDLHEGIKNNIQVLSTPDEVFERIAWLTFKTLEKLNECVMEIEESFAGCRNSKQQ